MTAGTAGRGWILALAGYFLLQALLRPLYGPALELDEAEAFWFSRQLDWGYGAQPPLFFWLQWLFLNVFGETLFALSLLKGALLGAAVLVIYRFLRPALPPVAAATAVMALALVPELSWEAQRALTHTVLVFFMSALAITTFWAALERATLVHWALFGVVLGAGILSKHNFPILPAGLVLACLLVPAFRRRLRPAGMVLALGVACMIIAPYGYWALVHPELATASLHKLDLSQGGAVAARITGLGNFAVAIASLMALPLLVIVPLWMKFRPHPANLPDRLRFAALGAICAVGLLLATALVAGIAEMRSRWLMPIVWPLVPVGVALVWPLMNARSQRLLPLGFAALWLAITVGLLFSSRTSYRAADFAAVENALPPGEAVVSDHLWLLGNLAFLPTQRALVFSQSGPAPAIGTPVIIAARMGRLDDLLGATGITAHGATERLDIARGRRMEHIDWTRATAP